MPALSIAGHWLSAKSAPRRCARFRSQGRQRVHVFVMHTHLGHYLLAERCTSTVSGTQPRDNIGQRRRAASPK